MLVVTGENGSGKTNLLEAISMFAQGRGLRRADLGACARRPGSGGFAVSLHLATPDATVQYGTGLEMADGALSRRHRVDREPVGSARSFADALRLVWLTPAMDSPVQRVAGRASSLPRSAGAGGRCRPRHPRHGHGAGVAPAQPHPRGWRPRGSGLARCGGARGRGAGRRRRRGAQRDDRAARGVDRCAPRRRFPLGAGRAFRRGRELLRDDAGDRRRGSLPGDAEGEPDCRTPQPAAPWSGRRRPTSSSATVPRTGRGWDSAPPASRRRCWSASCWRMPGSSPTSAALRPSCSWTRSPRISTRCGATRCSRSSRRCRARSG